MSREIFPRWNWEETEKRDRANNDLAYLIKQAWQDEIQKMCKSHDSKSCSCGWNQDGTLVDAGDRCLAYRCYISGDITEEEAFDMWQEFRPDIPITKRMKETWDIIID